MNRRTLLQTAVVAPLAALVETPKFSLFDCRVTSEHLLPQLVSVDWEKFVGRKLTAEEMDYFPQTDLANSRSNLSTTMSLESVLSVAANTAIRDSL